LFIINSDNIDADLTGLLLLNYIAEVADCNHVFEIMGHCETEYLQKSQIM